jgi:pantetheine-phosphate adenylyltransferase
MARNAMSACLLFTVVTVAAGLLPRIRRAPTMVAQTLNAEQGNYNHALLELTQPPKGDGFAPQLLQNDEMLARLVKNVRSVLYVYVVAAHSGGQESMAEYIASIYQRLWDEMIAFDKLNLECVVLGDVPNAGFRTRADMHNIPTLDAVYSFDDNVVANINSGRESLQLATVVSLMHEEDKAKDATDPLKQWDIHYFEDRGESSSLSSSSSSSPKMPVFKNVALGGTFDRLHNGHRKLLTLAASTCTDRLVIGITGDVMLSKKKGKDQIALFPTRQGGVLDFLRLVKPSLQLDAVELADPFGPTLTDATIEAIVVSSETILGAHMINLKRIERGFPALAILVMRRCESATLSSTFIREQEEKQAMREDGEDGGGFLRRVASWVKRAIFRSV